LEHSDVRIDGILTGDSGVQRIGISRVHNERRHVATPQRGGYPSLSSIIAPKHASALIKTAELPRRRGENDLVISRVR
jgi:hypothetical protein